MMNKNRRGQMTIFLILLLLLALFAVVVIFVGGLVIVKTNDALDINVSLGQVNLKTVNAQTIGQVADMYTNNADWWGIAIIFGMIFGLFISAYLFRNSVPKWVIVIDILIIVVTFIAAVYISSSYSILLDALATSGETFMEDYTPKTAMFVLNLPIFVVIIGVVMMVLFHSSIPRKREEEEQRGGLLQGV